jgi:hypothetical protein
MRERRGGGEVIKKKGWRSKVNEKKRVKRSTDEKTEGGQYEKSMRRKGWRQRI